jgi:hypothetical protein
MVSSRRIKIVFSTEDQKKQRPPARRVSDLQKLFQKKIIDESQLLAGEQLARDLENSLGHNSSLALLGRRSLGSRKFPRKIDSDRAIIQNLSSYERYHRAIMSLEDSLTRDVVYQFCINGIGLTALDKKLGNRRGAAEVRLCYGLRDLAKFYRREED